MQTSPANDKSIRCIGLAGVLVGAVALVGVGLTASEKGTHRHHHPATAIQFASQSDAVIAVGSIGATVAFALALMLWLGRRTADACPPPGISQLQPRQSVSVAYSIFRDRFSISYHAGGLYGP